MATTTNRGGEVVTGYYLLTDHCGREIARYKTARGASIGIGKRQRQLWATFDRDCPPETRTRETYIIYGLSYHEDKQA
jgi:hypothetical protein